MIDIDLLCLDPVQGVRIDEDHFHFDSSEAISQIRNLQSHYDELLAMAASESDDDDFSFQLDPVDSLINQFEFDEWDEDLEVAAGPIDDLLDHICNSSPHTMNLQDPMIAFDEAAPEPPERKLSRNQCNSDDGGCRKRSNTDIKKDALFQPLQHIYSLRYRIIFTTNSNIFNLIIFFSCSCGLRCVEKSSIATCMTLRLAHHGDVDEQAKTSEEKALVLFNIIREAFQVESKTFVFHVVDQETSKPRKVCEEGYLAILGLLTSNKEKPSMWRQIKATLRRGHMVQSEIKLCRDASAVKSADARAFIESYVDKAVESIPTAHTVKRKLYCFCLTTDHLAIYFNVSHLSLCIDSTLSSQNEDEDGAGVLEFENALNFWREYIVEAELDEKPSDRIASLDTFKRVLRPFLKEGRIRFTGCKGSIILDHFSLLIIISKIIFAS